MIHNALAVLACCILAVIGHAQENRIQGELALHSRWQGEIELVGDVTLPKGGKLVVAAGTRVRIAARDGSASGWHPERVEIHVHGQLVVEGSQEQPVVFEPKEASEHDFNASKALWHGIVLYGREDQVERRNQIRCAQFWKAFAGLQVPSGNALVEDCVFHSCSEGMQVGTANKNDRFEGAPRGVADPEIRRCRFTRCHTAIYATWQARAEVLQCVFHGCRNGVGCIRPGIWFIQLRPGSRVVGCAFVDVANAVTGSAVVRECWFLRCRVALRLSDYHDKIATDVEQVVFENNLVEEVEELVVGDTGAARGAIEGNVSPSGSLDDLGEAWPPLPDCLQLADDSSGKGRGAGGRDLGPMSTGVSLVTVQELPWIEGLQTGWLVAPVDVPRGWPKLAVPKPGGKVGNRWWTVADADPQGVLHLKKVMGFQGIGGLLALPFRKVGSGRLSLAWSADSALLEVALDGKVVHQQKTRCRFGATASPIEIDCSPGNHVLLFRIEGWGVDPCFGIRALSGVTVSHAPSTEGVGFNVSAKRVGKGLLLEARPSAPVHFHPLDGVSMVEVRDQSGREYPVDWQWNEDGALEIKLGGDLPPIQELRLSWKGLRDVLGKTLVLEPTMVSVP